MTLVVLVLKPFRLMSWWVEPTWASSLLQNQIIPYLVVWAGPAVINYTKSDKIDRNSIELFELLFYLVTLIYKKYSKQFVTDFLVLLLMTRWKNVGFFLCTSTSPTHFPTQSVSTWRNDAALCEKWSRSDTVWYVPTRRWCSYLSSLAALLHPTVLPLQDTEKKAGRRVRVRTRVGTSLCQPEWDVGKAETCFRGFIAGCLAGG